VHVGSWCAYGNSLLDEAAEFAAYGDCTLGAQGALENGGHGFSPIVSGSWAGLRRGGTVDIVLAKMPTLPESPASDLAPRVMREKQI
jgi:hypothetical protein